MVNKPKYLLDTCVCISMFRNEGRVREMLSSVGTKNCYISEITVAELYYGLAKASRKEEKTNDIIRVQKMFKVIPAFSAYKKYGEIRYSLEHVGKRVDQFDLLIGATAIHHGLTLVTSNTKHFERIEGITIENWRDNFQTP